MATTQGEIRIGALHQARLPDNRLTSGVPLSPDPELSKEREDLRWIPSMTLDGDLVMYLRAARSMAAFAGMCNGGSAEDGCIAASRDGTTMNAMDVLHDSGYEHGKALDALVKCPVPQAIEKQWSEEETKRFVKGLRQFGKNFYRIKKDLLPHKETPELVEFYYLWKKTPGANNSRPHRRRRQGSLRRNRNVRNTRTDTPKEEVGSGGSSRPSPSLKEQGEGSSASDDENSYDDSDSRENGGYRCQHCFTTNSRDWLHATSGPNQGALLCYACRSHYKQFGELPPVSGADTTYLFQPVRGDSPDSSPGRMRTRNKARETPTKEKTNKAKRSDAPTPEPDVEKKMFTSNVCDSPVGINSQPDKKKVKREVNRKRSFDQDGENDSKRKKENGMDSTCASGSDQSDNESIQDEREEPSPLIDKDFKLNTSSPLPPALEREESMENEPDERRDEIGNVANTYEESSQCLENQTDKKEEDGRCYNNVPPFLEAQSTQDYYSADSVNFTRSYDVMMTDGVVIKQENICSPQDGMPPVLSEECEDMTTLQDTQQFQCNSEFTPNNFTATDTPIIGQIKIEPGTQEEDDDMGEKNHEQNEPSQDQVSNYNQSCERSPVPQSVLLPAYPPFNDIERNDRPSGNAINHTPYSTYYYPHMEKIGNSFNGLQAEPQDLKIKQEVIPMDQMPPTVDPLQSLKEVKVPGYASSSVSQPLLPTTSTSTVLDSRPSYSRSESNSPSFSGIATSDVKKESDFNVNRPTSPFKMKPPTDGTRSVSPRRTSNSRTPPYSHAGPITSNSTSRSPILSPIANAPNMMPSSMLHPSQQPSPINRISPHLAHPHVYVPAMHPHPSLMQHSLFAVAAAHAAAMHHNPYSHHTYPGYPYSFPYGPYPIPQPIPPPRSMESQKREIESSTTLLTSHHSSSSSSITTRQVREDDMHSQEIHMSSSHHSSMHHHSDKQTISHSTSSSSSASVQHKVKRSSSPQHSSSSCHLSATLSQSTSSSSGHQSTHHHQHTHYQATGDPLSSLMNVPMQLGGRGNSSGSVSSQNKPSILPATSSVLPPHSGLSLGGIPTAGSLEALRAHAHAAALHSPMQLQSSMHGIVGHGGYLSPADMSMSGDVLKTEPGLSSAEDGITGVPDDDDIPSPTHHIPKGPSPEPKIEDSECHRSQSAIFLRHWNRGDYNSCARTDLMFKPVPDSKLARKREERVRKQTEKEREEREKVQARKMCTSEKSESKPPSRGPIETITSPYDRFTRGTPYADTPALRQLSEYARPHAGFSPVALQRSAASLGLPPQCIDPMLHYQLNMYGPTPRERLEMEHFEREKRERELRELREKDFSDRVKEEIMKTAGSRMSNPIESHWIDFQRRFGALGPGGPSLHTFGLYPPPGTGAQPAGLTPLERERFERLGIPPMGGGSGPRGPSSIGIPCSSATMGPQGNPHAVAQLEAAERLALATDPMVTLQMAGISPEYHAHSHAHTHAHSHTHLHLHPGQQSQGSQPSSASDNPAFSLPGSAAGFPRQSLLPPREAALALHHPSDLLARPYADQLAQQAAAHEHMQRQMLLERDRYPHPAILAQHEEYLRQQREIKVRALEEAARASRQ